MSKVTEFLPPRAHNQDAKHKFKRVKSLLLKQCPWALFHRFMEPMNDQLSYPKTSRENLVCEYKHPQSMAPIGNRPQVLQTSRTCPLHAERCLPVHARQRRQHDSSGAWPSGSPNSLRAERREISSLLAELNHRVEVTPGLSPLFFACKWLRLPPYACSSRAPRLLRGWAIHAPQINLPTALASWASSAVFMTRRTASCALTRQGPTVRLTTFVPKHTNSHLRGADHD